MNRVYIKTYGCQMNERDSEAVEAALRAKGYSFVENETEADIILINTCSVRDLAEQKALGKAGRLQKLKRMKPQLILGIMGCMAQNRGAELLARLPDLDLVVGTQKLHRVPEFIEKAIKTKEGLGPRQANLPKSERRGLGFVEIGEEAGSQNELRDHPKSFSVSAFISIQQGCDMRCAYCIVPKTRGDERSRPIKDIVQEVRELVANGTKEVVLLGQIVTSYGRKLESFSGGKSPFVKLLEELNDIEGLARIRFTSPHPRGFKDDLIGCFGRLEKLCEQVHLPLQSGSDRILRLMNRPYGRERYWEIVRALKEKGVALSTDIIVGFPGETEDDFEQTRELFERVGFDMAYIFKYSKRSGTVAAEMQEQVAEEVMERRNQVLLEILEKSSRRQGQKLVGTTQEVLVEGFAKRGGRLVGKTRGGRKVVFDGEEKLIGRLVKIEIQNSSVAALEGQVDFGLPAR